MKIKEILALLGPSTKVTIHDRSTEVGTVYQGDVLHCRADWDRREVCWLRVYDHELVLEVE